MANTEMPTKNLAITTQWIRIAVADAGKKKRTADRYADTACPGLSIRVRARGAFWTFSARGVDGKPTTWGMGEVDADDDPDVYRARAKEARKLIKAGKNPKAYLESQATGIPEPVPDAGGWTWEVAVEKYLAHVKARKAFATWDSHRKILKYTSGWNAKKLSDITARDLKTLQDDIGESGRVSTAQHIVRVVKPMLKWASDRGASGIESSPVGDVRQMEGGEKEKGRVPDPDEIGDMPWLLDRSTANAAAKLAAMIVLMTAQRRETVMSARRADFVEVDGEWLWKIPRGSMKVNEGRGEFHILPLHPVAAAVVRMALSVGSSGSEWLFPQLRLAKVGDAGDGHMAPAAPGKAMLAAKVGFTPHDVRCGFANWGIELGGFTWSEIKAVMDHAEGLSGDTTQTNYAMAAQLRIKRPIMTAWVERVLSEVRRRRPRDMMSDLPGCLAGMSA